MPMSATEVALAGALGRVALHLAPPLTHIVFETPLHGVERVADGHVDIPVFVPMRRNDLLSWSGQVHGSTAPMRARIQFAVRTARIPANAWTITAGLRGILDPRQLVQGWVTTTE
jgi:hypothetical protein